MHDLPTIWHEVSNWPAEKKRKLATRLLESLNEFPQPVHPDRQAALRQLIGIWKTPQPPDDEQARQIVEQARQRKLG